MKIIKEIITIYFYILEEIKNYSSDIYETSIHYYKILKKCQIMMK